MPHFPSPDNARSKTCTRNAEGASVPALPSDEQCLLVAKGRVIFPVRQNIPQYQDSQGKKRYLGPSLPLRIFGLLTSSAFSANYLNISGAGVAHALWEGLAAEGGADPDLKRNGAIWEKAGGGRK